MNVSNKISNTVKVLIVLGLISLVAFVFFQTPMIRPVTVPTLNKPNEIPYNDYYWVGQFVEAEPSLKPLAKHYIINDGIIDKTEYTDIVDRYSLINQTNKLSIEREKLREKLN
jgi:hypothetical protein